MALKFVLVEFVLMETVLVGDPLYFQIEKFFSIKKYNLGLQNGK